MNYLGKFPLNNYIWQTEKTSVQRAPPEALVSGPTLFAKGVLTRFQHYKGKILFMFTKSFHYVMSKFNLD